MSETKEDREAFDKGYAKGKEDALAELKQKTDAAFDEGCDAVREELQEPIDKLIAAVAAARAQRPFWTPEGVHSPDRKGWRGSFFWETLTRFLEDGQLPPEWHP